MAAHLVVFGEDIMARIRRVRGLGRERVEASKLSDSRRPAVGLSGCSNSGKSR